MAEGQREMRGIYILCWCQSIVSREESPASCLPPWLVCLPPITPSSLVD